MLDLEIENDLQQIRSVIDAFELFAEAHAVPPGIRRRVDLVLDELLNNVISYGYDDEDPHVIAVRVECSPRKIILRIIDDGRPFNPLMAADSEPLLSLDTARVGGFGLELVRRLMDDASYSRGEDRNVVELTKHLPTDGKRREGTQL